MEENTLWKNRIFECPYCKARSTFTCVFSVKGNHNGNKYPISVWECHYCDRGIFVKQKESQYDHVVRERFEIDTIFPSNEPSVSDKVPEGVAIDFIEAAKCFNISAHKASAVMSRRTIQKMCVNLGAEKSKKLYQQIQELKDLGKLHPDLADMATEIRFLGNDGAHPEDDGLDEIKEEDAKEILDFTAELLDDLYVRPQKILAMKKKREDKKEEQ
jgi:DNA-directed RNA polymerase subunit RPC12/RpoP